MREGVTDSANPIVASQGCDPDGVDSSGESMAFEHPLLKRRDRKSVQMRAYAVRADNQIIDVRVRDLCYEGCSLETETPLVPGEKITLSVLGRGAIKASVKWYKHRLAGIQFAIPPASRKHRPRDDARISLSAGVMLRRSARPAFNVEVFEASRSGCSCEFIERPAIGERLWIKFDGLEALEASVCWVEGARQGLKFATPMHPAVFELVITRLGHSTTASD